MRTPAGRSRSARRVAIAVTGALALGLAAIPTALGAAWLPWSGSGQVALGPGDAGAVLVSVPPDEPARGMVYRGLKPAKRGTACAGTYEVEGTGHCSHGPDAPPPGLDIRRDARPVAKPAAAATLPRRDTAPAPAAEDLIRGAGGVPADGGELALAPDAAAAVPVGPSGVVCDGDGQAGKRVQVLYAYGAGGTSRFAEYLPSFRKWAAGVDAIYDASAKETGGSRHLRYVTTAACEVDVREVEITAAGVKNFSTMIAELKKLGYGRTDRKYMIFSDSKVYCGIGSFAGDDKPGAGNRSNGGPSYGRSDAGCWNASVAAHELGHNLGAVNNSAPNSSKAGHCVDEYDVMCYKDGPTALLRTACTNRAQDQRLDCNHDDYYHTNPSPGSYLATRWNMADSQFLIDGGSGATPPVPTPANPTAGPPTAAPSPPTPRPPTAGPPTPRPPTAGPPTAGPRTPVPPTPVTPSPAPPSPTTAPDPTPTAGLAVLSATETTATSARLRWPAARTGTRYGVVLNSRTLGWTTATGSRLTGLRADTEYRVQVVLRSAGATTPYTGVLTLRTPSAAPPAAGAWFRLGNALTGEVADLYAGRAADRTPVVLRRGAGATSEQWRLEPAAGGTFLLRSRASGKCVTPLGGTAATGAPLVQAVCAPAAAGQRWRLTAGARGITLTAAGTDLVVGLGGSRFGGAGRLLVLQRPAGGAAQAWAAGPVD